MLRPRTGQVRPRRSGLPPFAGVAPAGGGAPKHDVGELNQTMGGPETATAIARIHAEHVAGDNTTFGLVRRTRMQTK